MNFWKKTQRFVEIYQAYPFITFLRFFTTSLTICFTLFLAYFLKEIVHSIEVRDMEVFLDTILKASIVMVAFQVAGIVLRNYFWVEQQFTWEKYLASKALKQFVQLEQWTVEALGTGKILSIIQKGTEESINLLISIISYFARIFFTVVFGLLMVRWLPWWIVAGGMAMIVFIFGTVVYFNKHTSFYRRQRKENNVKITGLLAKVIMSKFEILQNNSIEREIKKMNGIFDYSWDLSRRQTFWGSFLFQTPKFLLSCVIVGAYYYLGMRVFGGTYMLSDMVGLLTVLALFEVTLRDSIEYYENFTKSFVHIEKFWDFMDTTPQIQWYDVGKPFRFQKGDYEMQNISFSYHNNTTVLDNFSCTIQWGKKTALVGRSWGGKTTLMKLLAGYMRPMDGKLLVDGQDIVDMRLDSYYPHIGYLTQEPSVFDGTIEENLLYSMADQKQKAESRKNKAQKTKNALYSSLLIPSDVPDEAVQKDIKRDKKIAEAIELAECQFIYELENGLQTEIGERGIRLSGGQKQRLAIAKIFLKDPEIILLDEPTAALDSYSEQKVAKAFERLFAGRTVIVIAHRLQTVKSADDIIVLEKWQIAERGTHKTLLKLWKKYAGMVDLQSGVVREEVEEEAV